MNNSITVRGFRDLSQFGIEYLTGEADVFSLRGLCDLNEDGKRNLEGFFSTTLTLQENWNSQVNGKPAIGSIMLPVDLLPALTKYLLFTVSRVAAVVRFFDGSLVGVDEHYAGLYRQIIASNDATGSDSRVELTRNPLIFSSQPHDDQGRAVHAFTGRTV